MKEKFKSLSLPKKTIALFLISVVSFFVFVTIYIAITIWIPIASYKRTGKPEWVGQELLIKGYNDYGEKSHAFD